MAKFILLALPRLHVPFEFEVCFSQKLLNDISLIIIVIENEHFPRCLR